jgi:hypothetical protein
LYHFLPRNFSFSVLRISHRHLLIFPPLSLSHSPCNFQTTLIKLLVGETLPTNKDSSEIWTHHNLRVSYVAQHSFHHVEVLARLLLNNDSQEKETGCAWFFFLTCTHHHDSEYS